MRGGRRLRRAREKAAATMERSSWREGTGDCGAAPAPRVDGRPLVRSRCVSALPTASVVETTSASRSALATAARFRCDAVAARVCTRCSAVADATRSYSAPCDRKCDSTSPGVGQAATSAMMSFISGATGPAGAPVADDGVAGLAPRRAGGRTSGRVAGDGPPDRRVADVPGLRWRGTRSCRAPTRWGAAPPAPPAPSANVRIAASPAKAVRRTPAIGAHSRARERAAAAAAAIKLAAM
jgi:hypothetical protein